MTYQFVSFEYHLILTHKIQFQNNYSIETEQLQDKLALVESRARLHGSSVAYGSQNQVSGVHREITSDDLISGYFVRPDKRPPTSSDADATIQLSKIYRMTRWRSPPQKEIPL